MVPGFEPKILLFLVGKGKRKQAKEKVKDLGKRRAKEKVKYLGKRRAKEKVKYLGKRRAKEKVKYLGKRGQIFREKASESEGHYLHKQIKKRKIQCLPFGVGFCVILYAPNNCIWKNTI